MRFLPFFLCSLLFGQLNPDPLQVYLKATPEQWEQLQINVFAHLDTQKEPSEKLAALNRGTSAETLKVTPSAAELGRRYQQIEELCRSLAPLRTELYRKQMQVLSETQRALLAPLSAAVTQVLLDGNARLLFLKEEAPSESSQPANGTAFETPSPYFDPAYTGEAISKEIIEYLSLTGSQQAEIRRLHLEYRDFHQSNFSRMLELGNQLETEIARESSAADEIGTRYAEIELIRRATADRGKSLRRELTSLLTQPQRDLLTALDGAGSRWGLQITADSLFLFAPNERRRPASRASFPVDPFFTQFSRTDGARSGDTAATTIFRGCDGGPEFTFGSAFGVQATRQSRK